MKNDQTVSAVIYCRSVCFWIIILIFYGANKFRKALYSKLNKSPIISMQPHELMSFLYIFLVNHITFQMWVSFSRQFNLTLNWTFKCVNSFASEETPVNCWAVDEVRIGKSSTSKWLQKGWPTNTQYCESLNYSD